MVLQIDEVKLQVNDRVAVVVLNRPSQRNALSPTLLSALKRTLDQVSLMEEVQVIMLTGSPPAFCVGGDLNLIARGEGLVDSDFDGSLERVLALGAISQQLRESRPVSIAVVNGACAGAGLSLAFACDLRIAADTAVFNSAFLSAGAPGDSGGIWLANRVLGEARTRDLFLRPRRIAASEALRLGIVTMVTQANSLMDEAWALAFELAGRDPQTLSLMKQNLNDAGSMELSRYLDSEARRYVANAQRGVGRAMAQKFLAESASNKTGQAGPR